MEYWIGLNDIHKLTNEYGSALRIVLIRVENFDDFANSDAVGVRSYLHFRVIFLIKTCVNAKKLINENPPSKMKLFWSQGTEKICSRSRKWVS